ncbi:MAG TPA: flagellar hook protein FlgE, partial [Sporomusaceae bacterium]|nr:flagellar hook protein FlgE [Sporomusaceae bacterium]
TSLSQQTYHTNAVTTGLTLPALQMDSDLASSQTTPEVTVVDADGNVNTFSITFTQNGTGWDYNYTINGTATATMGSVTWDTATSTYAGLPTTVSVGTPPIAYALATTNPVAPASNPTTSLSTTSSQATLDNFDITPTTGATPMSIKANLNSITSYAGESTVQVEKDGYGAGTLDSKYIDTTGVIVGNFTNGQSKVLGQVALATFNNPSGLNKVGDNLFGKSVNSGEAKVGTSGSGGRGTFNPGNLEMSNVDLAQEFSNMIITQRGFQANSKIITTTDQMLEELANLKR